MKKTFLLLSLITIAFASCNEKKTTQDDIIRQKAEELIIKSMNDPDSYEFVSLEIVDSTTYKDNITHKRELYSKFMTSEYESITSKKGTAIESGLSEIKKDSLIIAGIDSIEQSIGNKVNDAISYTYILKCRGNNKIGAKILVSYYIQTKTDEDRIINITDDINKIYPHPCDFPGFKDLIEKHNPKYPIANRYANY